MSSFGISFLSKEALREARRFMNADQAGVRDEIGFLLVHQRYADRFFPGTSVLHTRLRYALFVPWIYADARTPRPRQRSGSARDRVAQGEHKLTGRLRGEDGVIGGRTYPEPIDQPPSYVYWTALQRWGLLREQPKGGQWTRAQVERILEQPVEADLRDADDQPLSDASWPFDKFDAPAAWRNGDKLSFKLPTREKRFLAKRLRATFSSGVEGERSLLSLLVGESLASADHAWSPEICALARHERDALERAGRAAALSAIGRAVYAAQVETLKAERDKLACSELQRAALSQVVERWSDEAAQLDWNLFEADMQVLPPPVSAALSETLDWVRADATDPMILEQPYRRAEEGRKLRRARLSLNHDGFERRFEWDNEAHGTADPLHYRWANVRRLLADLEGLR